MELPDLFASPEALRTAFARGLANMLSRHESLGVYILALANAANDPELWPLLKVPLEERHGHLAALITANLRHGRAIPEPEDDLLVFLKLMAIGFEQIRLGETRQAGPWEVQFNPLRALRPPRTSHAAVQGISAPFNPDGFHFNRPFLAKETLWTGDLLGCPSSLLYNKFPFAALHGLLVPEPRLQRPQMLTRELHDWAWRLTEQAGEKLPGFTLAYNSYGAYASVNHLHFQCCLRPTALPVASPVWTHNGGSETYPSGCQAIGDATAAWQAIEALHARETPYNLVHLPGRVFLLPRKPQGTYRHNAWTSGHAWYEMVGGVTTYNREDFDTLPEAAVEDELRLVSAGGEQDAA